MKKGFFILIIIGLCSLNQVFSQILFPTIGEPVKYKGQYMFNVVTNGWRSELVIVNSQGSTLLAFIPFKIQDGWQTTALENKNGVMHYRSGTSYTYFYRVAATSGAYCDVPVTKLYNIRNVARFVISFGLVKADALDPIAFGEFCAMHGKVYDNLMYFK